jgi:CheY-like chemotaxis protein
MAGSHPELSSGAPVRPEPIRHEDIRSIALLLISLRMSRSAAALSRSGWTSMSRISPSLSTARHSQKRLLPIATAISSDGISVVRELKADTDLRSIPVILVTAKADTKDVVQGLDAGGDDYLTKPFEHAALLARVRSMLRQKALHDTVQEQASQLAQWTEPC